MNNQNNSMRRLSYIATRIREMREIMGWTEEEMAIKTDVSVVKR